MSTPVPPRGTPELVLLVVIVLILAWRTTRQSVGVVRAHRDLPAEPNALPPSPPLPSG